MLHLDHIKALELETSLRGGLEPLLCRGLICPSRILLRSLELHRGTRSLHRPKPQHELGAWWSRGGLAKAVGRFLGRLRPRAKRQAIYTWQKMPEVNQKKGNTVREYAAIVARVAVAS